MRQFDDTPIAADQTLVFDVTTADFEAGVLARSRQVPVLVDFWASWCGPCKSLGPILERLAAAYGGAFLLAKVDVDAEQALAGHFQIRSIPTVMLVKDGRILDGFAGALPESDIRKFLGKHGIEPLDADAGAAADEPADPAARVGRLRDAVKASPDDPELRLQLAVALAETGDHAEAGALVNDLPANLGVDPRAQRVRARGRFATLTADAPDAATLERAVEQNPGDLTARLRLGAQLILDGQAEPALQQFLEVLTRDKGFQDGAARQALVDAFTLIDDDALVRSYRRRMTALLF